MTTAALPAETSPHVLAERTCLRCGAAADGLLRVAIWEEEEKGRLGARSAVLCAACHAGFLALAFGRVEVAHWYHAAKDYVPREWIGRIDRDRLLATTCLSCGVILDLPPDVDAMTCPQCRARNLIRQRGAMRITASLAGA